MKKTIWVTLLAVLLCAAMLVSAAAEEAQTDIQALYAANPDLVACLKVGGEIDEPIVQRDNEFYLDHGFDGEASENGAAFMNSMSTPDGDAMVVYAKGGAFGALEAFRDYEYLCSYPIVTFRGVNDAEDVYYTPVAVFTDSVDMNDEALFAMFGETEEGSDEEAAYEEYVNELAERSLWTAKTDATADDRFLILVTDCEEGQPVVVCRALREDETPEDIHGAV